MSKTVCVNGILKEGDKVLSAPSSDYPCLIGKVVVIEPISKNSSNEITTDTVIVDFMNIYGDERKNEIVECFQNLTENLELSYDEIEWCQRLRPSELIRLDASVINNRHFYNCILNSEASAALCAYIELKKCMQNRAIKFMPYHIFKKMTARLVSGVESLFQFILLGRWLANCLEICEISIIAKISVG